MKSIFKYIAIAASAVVIYGCQDDHYDINTNNLPSASDINVECQTLDENRVKFTLLNQGCTPIWYFDDGSQSTENGFVKQFPMAGDYTVEIKMYNQNGVCNGSITKEFTFTESFATLDAEIAKLTDGSSKVWAIAKDQEGFLGCGQTVDNPTQWYNAKVGEKTETGLFDDTFTFNADGTYTYNPGKDGLTYVNKGTTVLGAATADADFDAASSETSGTWKLEYRGATLYLVLSPKSLLGYLADDAQYEKPEFIVKQVAAKKITLLWAGDGIVWQYILSTVAEEAQIENLWNNDLEKITTYYNPDPDWGNEINDQLVVTQNGDTYKVSAPFKTYQAWQAQVHLWSTIGSEADKIYDFSVIITPNADVNGVAVKLTDTESDDNFVFAENVSITGGKANEIKFPAVKGVDAAKLKLVLDFGGCPENFEAEISDIVFGEHVGAIEEAKWEYNEAGDLTKGATYQTTTFYAHTDAWTVLTSNTLTDKGDGVWVYSLPDATDLQWQAQLAFLSQITTSAEVKYDFHVKLKSTTDISGVTVKVTSVASDDVIIVNKTIALEAGEEYEFIANGVEGKDIAVGTKTDNGVDYTGAVKFVFDFGGNPANTEITVSEIILQKSK